MLLLLLPATLGLHWYDDDHTLGQQLRSHERVTTVARGGTGTLGHATWRMVGRQVGGPRNSLRSTTPGAETLVLALELRPLDAQGVKDSKTGPAYRLRDREGHVWTGEGDIPETLSPGQPARVEVTALVPSEKVTSVVLELLPTAFQVKRGAPVPVLRFAH